MQAIGDRRCQSSTKEGSALPGWWSYPNTPEVYRCQKDKHPQAGLETEPPLMTAAGHNNVHNPYYLEHNGLWVGRGGEHLEEVVLAILQSHYRGKGSGGVRGYTTTTAVYNIISTDYYYVLYCSYLSL